MFYVSCEIWTNDKHSWDYGGQQRILIWLKRSGPNDRFGIKHENDYPLIFDAPTSSFTAAKESDFFGVIAGINKQTIIVTKSFLIEDADGNSKLDKERLKEIDAKKYRIEKKRPFDEKDLSTIQTTVESI